MFASRRDLTVPRPAAPEVPETGRTAASASLPDRETAWETAKRWALGIAYTLQPQRISSVPALLLWTAVDLLRGGTEIPDQNRTRSQPDTFGGVVRALTAETYLAALRLGFFPWAHCGPLKWWTRRERSVLLFPELHIQRRLKRLMRSGKYRVTFDTAFEEVVKRCAEPRAYNWHALTWLTPRFRTLFAELNRKGHTHSYEVWNIEGELVAGGFGTAIGDVFVGESMFSREPDTSKLASIVLYAHLRKWGFAFVDARDRTPVLEKQGYRDIPRAAFEALMREHASHDRPAGRWTATLSPAQALDALETPPDA
jgi:leucyl/phenylalanyl-tRNA--protein transferase